MNVGLFAERNSSAPKNFELIPGLSYLPDFVSVEEAETIVRHIEAAEWSTELARRVQHYGYKYDYKSRRISEEMRVGELPAWLLMLGERLVQQGIFSVVPDQVIINEYQLGQGISAHIDCQPCFGDTIASLSLLSTCIMDFTEAKTGEIVPVFMEPRSMVVMKADARYLWKHSIAKRKQDVYNGQSYARGRRVSLTFRSVKWE